MAGRPEQGTAVQPDGTKVCSKCLERKPASRFNNSASMRDGKDPHCKDCKKAQRQAAKAKKRKRKRRNG